LHPIRKVVGREILDSRGNPTVEVDVCVGEVVGRAAAPSGASKGRHEALELRDGGRRYGGKGVLKAVKNVNEVIAKKLIGMDVEEQERIDKMLIELDGTRNKSRLGANAVVATSLAVAKAAALVNKKPLYAYLGGNVLPVPMFNVLNGGKHAGNDLAIQEFMLMPIGAKSFKEALRMGSEIYHALGDILIDKYGKSARNVGDEGGYAPRVGKTREALDALMKGIEKAGYEKEAGIAIDAAASSFYDGKHGEYGIDGKKLSRGELTDYYSDLIGVFPIISLEDPFHEEDFDGFSEMTKSVGKKVQIVGDDLLVTNVDRLKKAIEKKSVNALLLKVNQVGTLTEGLNAANLCYKKNYGVIVSHRSGETEDTTIADIAVGIKSGQIKTGSLSRGERTAKYNQLLRIEEELGKKGVFAGKNFRSLKR